MQIKGKKLNVFDVTYMCLYPLKRLNYVESSSEYFVCDIYASVAIIEWGDRKSVV